MKEKVNPIEQVQQQEINKWLQVIENGQESGWPLPPDYQSVMDQRLKALTAMLSAKEKVTTEPQPEMKTSLSCKRKYHRELKICPKCPSPKRPKVCIKCQEMYLDQNNACPRCYPQNSDKNNGKNGGYRIVKEKSFQDQVKSQIKALTPDCPCCGSRGHLRLACPKLLVDKNQSEICNYSGNTSINGKTVQY